MHQGMQFWWWVGRETDVLRNNKTCFCGHTTIGYHSIIIIVRILHVTCSVLNIRNWQSAHSTTSHLSLSFMVIILCCLNGGVTWQTHTHCVHTLSKKKLSKCLHVSTHVSTVHEVGLWSQVYSTAYVHMVFPYTCTSRKYIVSSQTQQTAIYDSLPACIAC